MLPAVQTADSAEWRVDDGFERVGLAVAPVGTLDVSRLDLAPVMNDLAFRADKRLLLLSASGSDDSVKKTRAYLGDVETALVPLAISEHDKDAGLSHGGANPVHL